VDLSAELRRSLDSNFRFELTYVMMKMKAMRPFTAIVSMIILGTALLASSVSSAMWAAASEPANDAVAVIEPTKHAAPMLDQPP
jgi:ABC-type cobalt transport system substrate-binding protein